MDKLRRQRGALRGAVTRLLKAATEIYESLSPSLRDLQEAIDQLASKERSLKELDDKIGEALEGDEFDQDIADVIEYQENICRAISRLRSALNELRLPMRASGEGTAGDPPPVQPQSVEVEGVRPAAHPNPPPYVGSRPFTTRVVLPTLQVPHFSGEPREWQGFWDHFEATIHNHPDLPDIEKFKYLRSYLTGNAKRAVEWIRLNDANYRQAVKILTDRFGRTELLVDDHVDSLLSIAPIQSSTQVALLRDLYEQVQFRTGCLESLGVPASEYAVILNQVLMRSLSEDLALQYRERMKETTSDANAEPTPREQQVKAIMAFLKVQVESREESRALRSNSESKRSPGRQPPRNSSPLLPSALALAAGFASSSTDPPPGGPLMCCLCDSQGHKAKECRSVLTVEEKRRRLSKNRCCFRCARQGHMARSCRSSTTLKCDTCSGPHITVLCDIWERSGTTSTTAARRDGDTDCEQLPQRDRNVTTAPASSTCSSSVLLQTATVWASGDCGRPVLVRLLLDTGSQRTFVSSDLCRQLALPASGVEDLAVFTFGSSNRPRSYQCRKVAITLRSRYKLSPVTLDALEVPEVCTVKGPPVETEVVKLLRDRKLLVADEPEKGQTQTPTISVLVGSDNYWRLVSGRIERINDCLCAVETVFGWVLQGPYSSTHNPLVSSSSTNALFLGCVDGPDESCQIIDPSEMWRLDAIGITDASEKSKAEDYDAFVKIRSGLEEDGRYVVPLMIETPGLMSSTNRAVAESRLRRQLQRFEHQPNLLEEYDAVISEYFKEGHAERVVQREVPGETVYFLPHHAVVRQEAVTTKVRVVFDASSHEKGEPSLNDMLDKGVKLGPELLQLLLQFSASRHVNAPVKTPRRDLVVVQDDNVAPLSWKIGRVVQSFPGRDGVQRYHEILLPNGQRIRRAIQRLCLL
ncbi:uncharacterized protein LOC144146477 [Haemaphysalis longicornis]